ncbi:MAG: ISNCY family transposase [Anaerolineales bacterium]|nr:ISNCY family transposase [Anaerolineales bacterium]
MISKIERGEMRGGEAAAVLGISLRHLRRLIAGFGRGGVGALAHGNRGRVPANALDGVIKKRVVELAGSTYAGCNTQHFTELLAEREGISLSRSSVRRMLIENCVSRPRKRRAPKHRSRRERYSQEGMLVQMDGSRHDWLEGRGPWMTLVGAIDDATGKVLHALFREQEDTQGYFQLMEAVVSGHGIPMAIYRDGHAVFEPPEGEPMTLEEQLEGKKGLTQFGRLLQELNINSIRSRSPQARGRIERLWGTLQDRLVSELRLAEVRTISEANEILWKHLPEHNRKFAVPATKPGSAFGAPGRDWHTLFCLKYPRTVGLDNVVRFGSQRLQVLPNGRNSYARAKVEVREAFDGSITVYYQGHRLDTRPAPAEAPKLRELPQPVSTEKKPGHHAKPAPDHPWHGKYRVHLDGKPRW